MFHRPSVDPLVCNAFDLRKRFLQAAPVFPASFGKIPFPAKAFCAMSAVGRECRKL